MMMTAGREDDRAHYARHQTVREIVQQIVNGLLGTVQRVLYPQ